jgi:hypothetical protein
MYAKKFIPCHFLIDKNAEIVCLSIGYIKEALKKYIKTINKLLE